MIKTGIAKNIKLNSFDDLFHSSDNEKDIERKKADVVKIPLTKLHPFKNHPFQIRSDKELEEMIQSIKQYGVLTPAVARERPEGGYELISGHTRKYVCELLGLETMPVFIREADDDEACVIMVDSNIQRENILPSEKARAYNMKYEALKNQGVPGNSLQVIGEQSGENYKAIQRYIWLSRLSEELLAWVDEKKLGIVQGVSLSSLSLEEQKLVYEVISRENIKLSTVQATAIKQLSAEGSLNMGALVKVLQPPIREKSKKTVAIKKERLQEYFDEDCTEKEMLDVIYQLLREWKNDGRRNKA